MILLGAMLSLRFVLLETTELKYLAGANPGQPVHLMDLSPFP
tara:strand:- start:5678 stop:5803 length:126 start_codon:yes stop_codon:yes gene_type:complete